MMNPLDQMVTCPYEPSHRITKSRLPFHLPKCAKRHPNASKLHCPYDATHLIDPIDFEYHKTVCTSRGIWETFVHVEPTKVREVETVTETFPEAATIANEDWSGGNKVYNPEEVCLNKGIVRMVIGASKKERKNFRMAERNRFAKIEKLDVPKVLPKVEHDKPLRPPKNAAKALTVDANNVERESEKEKASIDNLISKMANVSTKDDGASTSKKNTLSKEESKENIPEEKN